MKDNHPELPTSSSIRLLEFEIDSTSSTITGYFTVTDLADERRPHYEALSYAWGDPSPVVEVKFPESNMTSGCARNLADALSRLHRDSPGTLMWIDAICINQKDVEERNRQVPLMGRMYSTAEQVNVWLGLDEDGTVPEALDILRLWANPCNDDTGGRETYLKHSLGVDQLHGIPEHILQIFRGHSVTVAGRNATILENLFRRPWFERIWCLQEAVLGRQVVVGHSEQILYDTICFGAAWMSRFEMKLCYTGEGALGSSRAGTSRLIYCCHLRQAWLATNLRAPIGTLFMTTYFKSSEPRNKIYSLLGMLDVAENLRHYFHVDYERPVEMVIAQATKAIVEYKSDLMVMYAMNHDCGLYPSWVPDWSRENEGFFMAGAAINASAGVPVDLQPSTRFDELRVTGMRFGRINKIYDTASIRSQNSARTFAEQLVHLYLAMQLDLVGNQVSMDDLGAFLEIFAWVVTWRYSGNPGANPDQIVTDFSAYLMSRIDAAFLYYCERNAETAAARELIHCLESGLAEKLEQRNQDSSGDQLGPGDPERFLNATGRVFEGAQLFTTDEGLTGLARGRGRLHIGDQICILFGGRMPFVLRKDDAGQYWRIIAAANVEGIMDGGEAWDGREHEEFGLI